MKNNKLFNKVLSKSAMLLIVAGITMNSGAVFNIYAQDTLAADTTASVDANSESTSTQSEGERVSTASEVTSAANKTVSTTNETADTKGRSVATVRYVQSTWSNKYSTSQNCRPNVIIRPSRPNTNCPISNKPSVETPETETPSVETPETETPSVETPEIETPSVETPETETPSVETPETETPSVETPETETPETETPSEEVSSQSSFENEVLRLVNVERAKQGLAALQMDESIRNVARVKATDMYKNNYFSHTSPTYGTPFAMLQKYGISYKAAAENIAKGQTTPAQVVNSWMNSSGHRANILNAKYTHIGIGYEAKGNHWVQMFVGK